MFRRRSGKKGGGSNPSSSGAVGNEEEEIQLDTVEERPRWNKNFPLSTIRPKKWQAIFFQEKLSATEPFLRERLLWSGKFEQYGLYETFRKWGWLAALQPVQTHLFPENDRRSEKKKARVYDGAVSEWLASLEKESISGSDREFKLVGKVNGRKATLTLETFHQVAGGEGYFDTGVVNGDGYLYPTAQELFGRASTQMLEDLFRLPGGETWDGYQLRRRDLKPWAQIILRFMMYNIMPRTSDPSSVYHREIRLLHALYTGSPAYSLRHVMMLYIWDCREQKERGTMPFTRFLSAFLKHAKAVSGQEETEAKIYSIDDRLVGWDLIFSYSGGEYCVEHMKSRLRDVYAPDEANMEVDEEPEFEDSEEDEDYVEGEEEEEEEEEQPRHSHSVASSSEWGQWRQQHESRHVEEYNALRRMLEEQRNMQQAAIRASYATQEMYRNEDSQYFDNVRSWHLHQQQYPQGTADAPPSPDYPRHPGPMYYQPPPPAQPVYREPRAHDPWNMDELTSSLVSGIFGPSPPRPPSQ